MDLGTALYKAISGRQPRTEVHDFPGALKWLSGRYGTKTEAARALGVPRSTFTRWLGGSKPKAGRGDTITEMVRGMQRRVRLSPGRERRLRAAPARDFQITGTIRYSSIEEDREVGIGRYLDPSVPNDLVTAFLDGASPDELAEIFHEGILDDGFYYDTFDPHGNDNWDIREVWGWA